MKINVFLLHTRSIRRYKVIQTIKTNLVVSLLLLFLFSIIARADLNTNDMRSFEFKGLAPGTDLTPYIDAGLLKCRRAFDEARSAVCGTTDKLATSNFKTFVGQNVVGILIQALDNRAVRIVVIPEFYRSDPERIENTILALSEKYGNPAILERGNFESNSYATTIFEILDENRTKINPRLWRSEKQTMMFGKAMPSRRDIYRATNWESFTYFSNDNAYPGELGFDDIATQTWRMCLIITDEQSYQSAITIHYNELLERQARIRRKREKLAADDI